LEDAARSSSRSRSRAIPRSSLTRRAIRVVSSSTSNQYSVPVGIGGRAIQWPFFVTGGHSRWHSRERAAPRGACACRNEWNNKPHSFFFFPLPLLCRTRDTLLRFLHLLATRNARDPFAISQRSPHLPAPPTRTELTRASYSVLDIPRECYVSAIIKRGN